MTATLTQPALEAWGMRIGRDTGPPLFIALHGELGAGKSVLARAVARGAGVRAVMPSPTFNLMYRYDGSAGAEVVHLDLYRLDSADQVWDLGWRELGAAHEIVLVEWAERAQALLPPDRWDITLETVSAELRRVRAEQRGTAPAVPAAER